MKQHSARHQISLSIENTRGLRSYMICTSRPKKRFWHILRNSLPLNDIYEGGDFVYERYPVRSKVNLLAIHSVSQVKQHKLEMKFHSVLATPGGRRYWGEKMTGPTEA